MFGPLNRFAVRASQRKIAFHGLASMLLGENVVNLKDVSFVIVDMRKATGYSITSEPKELRP
jgi:hypothetical protein